MKPVCLLLSLGLLIPAICEAQTRPAPTTNRQQELYDQYHGITKKPTSATTAAPITTTPAPAQTPSPAPIQATEATVATVPAKAESSTESAAVRIGVRGGITYPVFLEEVAQTDPTVGFVGGLVFQFGRGKLSFQPEINYSRTTLNTDIGFGKFKASSDQIVVPLFLKIASGTFAGNRFFVNVGPYGAYLASISQNGIKRDIDSGSSRFAFGAAAGVGAMIKAGPGHVTIEARGLYALGNDVDGFSTDAKTILAEGTLGYIFPLGRR
ncbi:porin family protein [Spirosoma sp. SC4-14]|uniref:porin family protein n=1 Tax=Spirosoma sp. SC4-14 TaxID=3128900 RepID=UPI0030D5D4F8